MTAMQELYKDLNNLNGVTGTIAISDVLRMIANRYLPLESQQLSDAWDAALDRSYYEESGGILYPDRTQYLNTLYETE